MVNCSFCGKVEQNTNKCDECGAFTGFISPSRGLFHGELPNYDGI
jgi:hypothetical protein